MALLESALGIGLIIGSNGLDYQSTIQAKNRGAIEINSLYSKPGTLEGGKIIFTTAEVIVFKKLQKKNRVLAWAWTLGITGINVAIARHNNSVLR
jgi:hypothetical protein